MEERIITSLHNNPPDVVTQVKEEQSEKYAHNLREYERLMAKRAELPQQVTNDEESGQISDWVKLTKALSKDMDRDRLAEKKKFTVWSDAVQNFWKNFTDKIEDAIKGVSASNDAYLQKKRDEEARAREEKARIAREEADRKLREAQEAERIANEKLAAERKERERIEREAEEARKAREAEIAERERKAREESDRRLKEAKEREDAARAREEKAKAELQAERDRVKLAEKIDNDRDEAEAEDRRRTLKKEAEAAEEERRKAVLASRETKAEVKELEKETKAAIKEIRAEGFEEDQEREADLSELSKEAHQARRAVGSAMDDAVRADKLHQKAEKQTLAGAADLSRTRGFGSVATLREDYEIEVANREELDLELLREFFTMDSLNLALRAWMRANMPEDHRSATPTFKGAFITQKATSVVR